MADSVSIQQKQGDGEVKEHPPVPLQEAQAGEPVKIEQPIAASDVSQHDKPEPVAEAKGNEEPSSPQPENVPSISTEGSSATKVESKTGVPIDGNIEEKINLNLDKVAAVEGGKEFSNGDANNTNDWQEREAALLVKIQELEKLKNEKSEDTLKMELKVREEEIDLLKARVKNLETELHAALSKPGAKNHEMIENIKQQHEELLSKARGMIFDKTKMVKNQELQIEALTTQVQSLKDINLITKDLLEIRNSEVKAMEDRLQAMEARFKAEKDRYGLVLQRAQTSSNINDDLKKEYETQLKIFKELRTKYEQKVEALVAENNKLKMDLAKCNAGGTSTEAPK